MNVRSIIFSFAAVACCLQSNAKIYKYWECIDIRTGMKRYTDQEKNINKSIAKDITYKEENAKDVVDIIFALMPITHETQGEQTEIEGDFLSKFLGRGTHIAYTILQALSDKEILVANGGLIRKFFRFIEASSPSTEALGGKNISKQFFSSLAGPNFEVYQIDGGKMGVFIYKPNYVSPGEKLHLEKLGLNSKRLNLVPKKANWQEQKKVLQETFKFEKRKSGKKPQIDINALNSIWSGTNAAKKTKFRVVVNGHGSFDKTVIKRVRNQLEKIQENILQLEKKIEKKQQAIPEEISEEDVLLAQQQLASEYIRYAQEKKKPDEQLKNLARELGQEEDLLELNKQLIEQQIKLRKQQEQLYQERVAVFKATQIVGLSAKDFLSFFEKLKERNCQLLYLMSCYARGLNELLYDEIVKFPILTDNFPDAVSLLEQKLSYEKLFVQLHLFIKSVESEGGWKKWIEKNRNDLAKPLRLALEWISTNADNLISIRFPFTNRFESISTNPFAQILSYSKISLYKKHSLKTFRPKKTTETLLLEADIVDLLIESAPKVLFVPMIFGPSHYFLEGLVLTHLTNQKVDLKKILARFENKTQFYKLFFIKNLLIQNYDNTSKETLLPFDVPEGDLRLQNVALLIPYNQPQKKNIYFILFKHKENCYRAKYITDDKQLAFEGPIEFLEFRESLESFLRITKPLDAALEKTTGFKKEKEFNQKIKKALDTSFSLEQKFGQEYEQLRLILEYILSLISVERAMARQYFRKLGFFPEEWDKENREYYKAVFHEDRFYKPVKSLENSIKKIERIQKLLDQNIPKEKALFAFTKVLLRLLKPISFFTVNSAKSISKTFAQFKEKEKYLSKHIKVLSELQEPVGFLEKISSTVKDITTLLIKG